jgi:hypothetical protein
MKIQPVSCKYNYDFENWLVASIEIIDIDGRSHIFSGLTINDEFVLPQPFGCPFVVNDIAGNQWESQNYEVEFLSGYSREGVFTARSYEIVDAT